MGYNKKESITNKEKQFELDQFRKNKMDTLVTEAFILHCFHTLTGIKIILVCNINNSDGNLLLKSIYEIYSDFVSKDPMHIVLQFFFVVNFNFLLIEYF